MARRPIEGSWEQYADSEAHALAQLLGSDQHPVMVIVIRADSDVPGTTRMLHAVEGTTFGSHLRQFIAATESQLEWLTAKLHRRG
jgi:hypothetical protein